MDESARERVLQSYRARRRAKSWKAEGRTRREFTAETIGALVAATLVWYFGDASTVSAWADLGLPVLGAIGTLLIWEFALRPMRNYVWLVPEDEHLAARVELEEARAEIASLARTHAPQQGLVPTYSLGGDQHQYWVPDEENEDTGWNSSGEAKDVEIDWLSVPDSVDAFASLKVRVVDKVDTRPMEQTPGYGIFRIWNVTDATVAVMSAQLAKMQEAQTLTLRIPRAGGARLYRVEMFGYGRSTMVSAIGEVVFRRRP